MSLYVNSVIKCNNNQYQFWLNPLSANPTKWSNTLKQFARNSGRIILMCLT